MAIERTDHSAANQVEQLRAQLFAKFVQRDQQRRIVDEGQAALDRLDAEVLALTNLIGGADLGFKAGREAAETDAKAKAAAAEPALIDGRPAEG